MNSENWNYLRTSCQKRQFESRSIRRGLFRRYGWMVLWALLLGLFALGRWSLHPSIEVFRGMNLSLPGPTRWLLQPNWLVLLCPFVVLYICRNRSDLRLEDQARDGWDFLCALAAGHGPGHALPLLGAPHSHALQEVLASAALNGRCVRKTALAWVHGLEWDLMWKNWTRRWRWLFALLSGSVVTASFVALGLLAPWYQLTG